MFDVISVHKLSKFSSLNPSTLFSRVFSDSSQETRQLETFLYRVKSTSYEKWVFSKIFKSFCPYRFGNSVVLLCLKPFNKVCRSADINGPVPDQCFIVSSSIIIDTNKEIVLELFTMTRNELIKQIS